METVADAMFEPEHYELLDFGAGRKLERFGSELLDRPSPAADGVAMAEPGLWGSASARYHQEKGGKGQWSESALSSADSDGSWSVSHGQSQLLIQLGPSGNVGLFPEQADNWDWISRQVAQSRTHMEDDRPRVLNLFGYTGGASLAAAAAGAAVTQVDSSAPAVAWAKRNADASGLSDLRVRWLVEDAMKFVRRERRRGNFYHGIIADPPTYGHGPKGQAFKFNQHLPELMELCGELVDHDESGGRFLLFSCHAPGFSADDAVATLASVIPGSVDGQLESGDLELKTRKGRTLAAGVSARWSNQW